MRGTDFARKEVLRLVHLERKSVISCQASNVQYVTH